MVRARPRVLIYAPCPSAEISFFTLHARTVSSHNTSEAVIAMKYVVLRGPAFPIFNDLSASEREQFLKQNTLTPEDLDALKVMGIDAAPEADDH